MSVNRYDPATDTLIPVSGTNNHLKDEMVAEYESTSTATHAYEVGGQFIYNGKLYTAITDIAEGDSIVPPGDIVSNITLQGSTVISKIIVDGTEYINYENSIPVRAGSTVSLYSNYPMYYSDDSHDSSGIFLSNTACHFIVPNNASGNVNLYVDLKTENKLLLQFYNNGGASSTNGWLLDVTPVGGEGTSQFNCTPSDSLTEQIAKKGSADNFIGTKQQWEALTPEEQAKYKTMDFIGDSGGGNGGHTIIDESGTEMPQRSKLQFEGAIVSDDETNDATVVETVNPVKYEEDIGSLQHQLTDQTNVLGARNFCYPAENTKTVNGVTFTVNSDNTLTISTVASGATRQAVFEYDSVPKNTMLKLNGCPAGGDASKYELNVVLNIAPFTKYAVDYGEGSNAFNVGNNDCMVNIVIRSGQVITTPITFKPMLRLASDPDDTYVPYAMTNRELTEDVGTLKTNLKATYNSAEIPFKFGIDANGNYGYIKAGADSVTPFKSGLKETVLWSNPNPAAAFYAQAITVPSSLSDYDYIKVPYRMSTADASQNAAMRKMSDFMSLGNTTMMLSGTFSNTQSLRWLWPESSNRISFSNTWQGSSKYPDRIIPLQIIGMK